MKVHRHLYGLLKLIHSDTVIVWCHCNMMGHHMGGGGVSALLKPTVYQSIMATLSSNKDPRGSAELYFIASAHFQMDDSCPLWMWRGSVEVDAAQEELLHRLLREQQLWEGDLHRATVIQTLSKDADVYRYLLHGPGHGLGSQPLQEHLLIR